MDNKKNFLKDCINTVAGLEINNESQTIAKEVVLSTLESLEKENIDLKKTIKVNEKSRIKMQQSLMKEKDKSKKILDELEKWLNEKWECPGSKIYIGEIVKEIQDLKGDEK